MELCFYLEKQWSNQNLTNQTVCHGLDDDDNDDDDDDKNVVLFSI